MRVFLLVILCALCASPARSADYCVSTVSEFAVALDQAEVDGVDSEIQLRSGEFALPFDLIYQPTSEFVIPAGKLTIRGGYGPNCTTRSDLDGATRLTGNGSRLLYATTQTGDVSIAGLSFEGVQVQLVSEIRGPCLNRSGSFNLRRLRFNSASIGVASQCHDLLLDNVLVIDAVRGPFLGGNECSSSAAVCVYAVDYDEEFVGSITIINSTFVNGEVDVDSVSDLSQSVRLYNTIVQHSATELVLDGGREAPTLLAVNSRWDSRTGNGVLLPTSANNTTAAAALDANFTPTAASPMRNTGTANVPGGLPAIDQTGAERVIGAQVDRGARESPIDGTGVFTVTNALASGIGSLPWAIAQANAEPGYNYVRFNIPGACPRLILLSSSLQVSEAVQIDGWSQPGSVQNTLEGYGWNAVPCVILRGPGNGIGIESLAAIGSGAVSVRGLAFDRYALAIGLAFGSDHQIFGNQFGGRIGGIGGLTLDGNQQAIGIVGGERSVIGGNEPRARNLIGGASDVGVLITTFLGGGGSGNSIVNNLIGLDKNGQSALPNGTGIRINGADNLIQGNLITGNTVDGVLLSGSGATGNQISDNDIGGGLGALNLVATNGRMGVMVQNEANRNQIGPDNRVGRNGDDGIRIFTDAGGRNRITGNRLARNDALGVDLGANGVSANDNDPQICGPTGCTANRGQNFPIILSATRRTSGIIPVGRPVEIRGTLRSVFGGPYRIEFYTSTSCDANGHGEGARLIGAINVTIPNEAYCPPGGGICVACTAGNCTTGFSTFVSEIDVVPGTAITATATSPQGDTSEFSECRTSTEEARPDAMFANGFEAQLP